MRIAVVTGNPKPASRTHGVALAVADTLRAALVPSARSAPKVPSPTTPGTPAPLVVDLAEHAPALFDSSDAELTRLTTEVAAADVAIFGAFAEDQGSPTTDAFRAHVALLADV